MEYFRLIDDLYTFNNYELENNYNIYPDELDLKKENEDPFKTWFLDLSIEVRDGKFTTELFEKRDASPFYFKGMPYCKGLKKQSYLT